MLTGRWPREFTLSQNVEIDECMVIAVPHSANPTPTRFVHLDRMPHDEDEVAELHQALRNCQHGLLTDGWGEVSYMAAGTYRRRMTGHRLSGARLSWRRRSWTYKSAEDLIAFSEQGILPKKTGASIPAQVARTRNGPYRIQNPCPSLQRVPKANKRSRPAQTVCGI